MDDVEYHRAYQDDDARDDEDEDAVMALRMRLVAYETEVRVLRAQLESQRMLLASLQDAVMNDDRGCVSTHPSASASASPSTSPELPLHTAIVRGDIETIQILLKGPARLLGSLDTALQVACQHRQLEAAELLIKVGADIHADHDCALLWACHAGDADIVGLLLRHGANPSTLHDLPMRMAVSAGNVDVVRSLSARQ